jgi:stage V sporulation protein S
VARTIVSSGVVDNNLALLKVSGVSKSKSVAGAISHGCRGASLEGPSILATGALAVNTAIKAIAIARGNLEQDQIDLRCTPTMTDKQKIAYTLAVTKSKRTRQPEANDAQELKVPSLSLSFSLSSLSLSLSLSRPRQGLEAQTLSLCALHRSHCLHRSPPDCLLCCVRRCRRTRPPVPWPVPSRR